MAQGVVMKSESGAALLEQLRQQLRPSPEEVVSG
jgi:hypothetical protein